MASEFPGRLPQAPRQLGKPVRAEEQDHRQDDHHQRIGPENLSEGHTSVYR